MSEIATLQCWELQIAYGFANGTEKDGFNNYKMRENIVVSMTADGKPVKIYPHYDFSLCFNCEGTEVVNLPKAKRNLQSKSKGSMEHSHILSDDSKLRYPDTNITVTIDGNTLKAKVEPRSGTEGYKAAVEFTLSTDMKVADATYKLYDGGWNLGKERLHVWAQKSSEAPVPK